MKLPRSYDAGLLVIRLGVGLTFLWLHGWSKITGGPERWARLGGSLEPFGIAFAPEIWGLLAALAESLGGLLLALGLIFRPAAFALLMTMAIAVTSHLLDGDGWRGASHALKMAFVFLGLFVSGPGRYSLDERFFGDTRRRLY